MSTMMIELHISAWTDQMRTAVLHMSYNSDGSYSYRISPSLISHFGDESVTEYTSQDPVQFFTVHPFSEKLWNVD